MTIRFHPNATGSPIWPIQRRYTPDFPAESSVDVLRCAHTRERARAAVTRTRADTQRVISSVSRVLKCRSHGIRGYQGNEDHKMALIFLREGSGRTYGA